MSLTSKELMLLQDNLKMKQHSTKFFQVCSDMATDSQVKSLCQQLSSQCQNDMQTLAKHITTANVQ